jgi:hypothetical protein
MNGLFEGIPYYRMLFMRTEPDTDNLTPGESDLAVNFYDVACDYKNDSFIQVAARVMPAGWGNSTEAFKREARRMFDLARTS